MLATRARRRGPVAARARRRHVGRPGASRRCARPGAVVLVGERLAEVPGAFSALARAGPRDRRPAGLGAPARRRARRGRGRCAARPAARRPRGRRRRRRAPRSPALGRGARRAAPRAATSPASSPPPATASWTGCSSAASTPPTCPTPRWPRPRWPRAGFVVSLELFPQRRHRARRRRPPGRRRAGEGRRLPRLGGPGPALRRDPARHRAADRRPGAARDRRRDGRRAGAAAPSTRPAPSSPPLGAVPPPGRGRRLDVRAAGRRPTGRRRGGARLLAAAARRRHAAARRAGAGRHRPAAGRPRRPGRRRAGSALADGDRLTVNGATGSVTLPVRVTAMPDRVVWLPMRSPGSEVRGRPRHRPRRRRAPAAPEECAVNLLAHARPADARGLRARRLVDRAHQDRRHLRAAGRA